MACFNGKSHQPQRVALNSWDDVTQCAVCKDVLQVHADVRAKNPNFAGRKEN